MDERGVESSVHPSGSEEAKIFSRYSRAVKESEKLISKVHKRAKRNWGFTSSLESQWEQEDLERQEDMQRPALNLDRIGPTMRIVTGEEALKRFKPRIASRLFGPLPEGFVEAADDLVQWSRDQSQASYEESEMFSWLYVCGYSAAYRFEDYVRPIDGIVPIVMEHVPLYDVLWDAKARKQNLIDRRYAARIKEIDEDEFKNVWLEGQPQEVIDHLGEEGVVATNRATWSSLIENSFSSRVRSSTRSIVEFEWKEVRKTFTVFDPRTRGVVKVRPADLERLLLGIEAETGEELPKSMIEGSSEEVVRYAFIAGQAVLEHGERPVFRLRFETAFPFPGDGEYEFFGPVDGQIDPQKFRNRLYSLALTHYAASPKGLLLYDENLITNPQELNDRMASPAASIAMPSEFFDQEKPRYQFVDAPSNIAPPPALFELATTAIEDQVGAAGVLSQQNDLRRISGSVVKSVEQLKALVMSKALDSHRRGREEDTRVVIEMMRNLYTSEDVQKIIGPEKAQQAGPIEQWPSAASFVIKVEDTPVDTDELLELWDFMTRTGFADNLMAQGVSVKTMIEIMPRIDATIKAKMVRDIESKDAMGLLIQTLAADPGGQQILQQVDQQTGGAITAAMQQRGA